MSNTKVQRAIGLIACLDLVEQEAIYDLLVHRVRCLRGGSNGTS